MDGTHPAWFYVVTVRKMANRVTGINSKILRWARERAGYTLNDVALALKQDVGTLKEWESGESSPTYAQLETLAYKIYRRPLALFFFPEPPDERDPTQEFRTLPDFEIEELSSDTRYAIRHAEAMQLALREINDGRNPAEEKIFRDIKVRTSTSADSLAVKVRKYLGVSLNDQERWRSNEEALRIWRALIQDRGIFVFKRSFKQRDISGFCLVDEEFPVIYLNNSTAPARQTFTLFHELAHILLHTSGVTKWDDSYIELLKGRSRRIEVFANQFVGEILIPSQDFEQWLSSGRYDDQYIGEIAERYCVSREVILRKLLDRGLVDAEYYKTKAEQWNRDFEKGRKSRGGGGNYYATQATYLGDRYLELAFRGYYRGRYGIEQLADYLNVKVRSVPGLEQFVFGRMTA
jgi:Zn-dependent peptidase ImmA (M78 family)